MNFTPDFSLYIDQGKFAIKDFSRTMVQIQGLFKTVRNLIEVSTPIAWGIGFMRRSRTPSESPEVITDSEDDFYFLEDGK